MKTRLSIREIALFGMFGALMYASKELMAVLPNIHLIGVFFTAYTVVYRKKALFPIYIFTFLEGLFNGFNLWWIPYLYIWTVLWGAVMLLPKQMGKRARIIVYAAVCGLHGILYGTLYAPFQALAFGLSFKGTIAWIAAGLPFDLIHGLSNLVLGFLIVPITAVLKKLNRQIQ